MIRRIVDKTYRINGDKKSELTHTTGVYIRKTFGDSVVEISHKIGGMEQHDYYFGEDLGQTYVGITKIDEENIHARIIGEENGHTLTKSKLEEKFKLTLTEI